MAKKSVTAVDLILRETTLSDLARVLGVTRTAVWAWRHKPVPVDRLEEVYRATGIPPAKLRPDLARLMRLGQPKR